MIALPAAARALVRTTPLVEAPSLGCWLKLESLQRTGSFKLRGAAVALAALDDQERRQGVVVASAGNHGAGIAFAAARLAIPARVIVPSTTPEAKRRNITSYGAELRVAGHTYEEAEAEAMAEARATGRRFISPFDDERVIDGNGRWLGVELSGQIPGLATVVVPVGGGGMAAGLAEVLAPAGVRIIGVQPRTNCAMHESLRLGRALTTYQGGPTACEGLEGPVAERTFRLARAGGLHTLLVDEEAILEAMAFAYLSLGLLVEASAAVGLAALREGLVPPTPRTVVIVTGQNLDPELLDQAVARYSKAKG